MDDTPDKLRRNVVALSAAILAIALFHLSFRPTGNLLGFAEVGNVSALKVWIALTLVLLYMFLRYRFDESTADALSAKREEFEVALRRAIVEQVNTAVNAHLNGAPLPDGLYIDVDELRAFTARLKGMYVILTEWCDTGLMPDRFGRQYANLGVAKNARWSGRMVFTAWGTRDVENKVPFRVRIEPRYIVMLEPPSRTRVLVRTQLRFIVSKGSIDFAVPFVMATLAMFICFYEIGFYLAK